MGMGSSQGRGRRCCRDTTGTGTEMLQGWGRQGQPGAGGGGPSSAPGSPCREGDQGHQGVWEAPGLSCPPPPPSSALTPGHPPSGHPGVPCTLLPRGRSTHGCPQVMGATASPRPPGWKTPGGGRGGCPQPRAPAPIPAGAPDSSPGHRLPTPGPRGCLWGGFCCFWCWQWPMAARGSAGGGSLSHRRKPVLINR